MRGYPLTYGDELDEKNGFTSETIIMGISDYCSNEKNQTDFTNGLKFGLFVFSIGSILLASQAVFASDSEIPPVNNDTNIPDSCPTTEQGTFGARVLGMTAAAIKSPTFWLGFAVGVSLLVVLPKAGTPVKESFKIILDRDVNPDLTKYF